LGDDRNRTDLSDFESENDDSAAPTAEEIDFFLRSLLTGTSVGFRSRALQSIQVTDDDSLESLDIEDPSESLFPSLDSPEVPELLMELPAGWGAADSSDRGEPGDRPRPLSSQEAGGSESLSDTGLTAEGLSPEKTTDRSETSFSVSRLGAGWSEYYVDRDNDQDDGFWLDGLSEDWPEFGYDDFDSDDAITSGARDQLRPFLIWPLVLTAFTILTVVTGGLTLYVRTLQANLAAIAQRQYEESVGLLNESLACVQEADMVVVAMDKALASPVTEASVTELEELLVQVNVATQTLDSARVLAEQARDSFVDPADQLIAQCVIDSVSYKTEMLIIGVQLLRADIDTMRCAVQFDMAWEAILSADQLMREAVSTVTTGGTYQITRAREFNRSALAKLDNAREALRTAGEFFPEANFSSISDYLEAKRDSCLLAIASDDALLEYNYNQAGSLNDQFHEKDKRAVELAKLIPDNPLTIIEEAYDEKTSVWRSAYYELFEKASQVDALIREWKTNNNYR
jgi:hypothetical protein